MWATAVLVAEVVKSFQPRLVELHNYRCKLDVAELAQIPIRT